MSLVNSFDEISENSNAFVGMPNLKLKDDKEYALVRIMHPDANSYQIHNVHSLEITTTTGKKFYSTVDCLRGSGDPVDSCPLCNAGIKVASQVLVHLLVYTTDEHGEQIITPTVWARTAFWVKNNLIPLYGTYSSGNLPEALFKITRCGKKGDQKTTYTVEALPESVAGKPTKYNLVNYPIPDEDLFDGYEEVGERSNITTKSFEDMEYFVRTGNFPFGNNRTTTNVAETGGEPKYMEADTESEELPFDTAPTPRPSTPTQPWQRTGGAVRRYN